MSLNTDRSRPVFISYASQDATLAERLVALLEGAGVSCWIAPRDVVPGAQYADEIIRAINECTVAVLLLSAQSAASAHVGRELERASAKNRRIIAVRADATPLPPAFEYFLSESQWIELGGGVEAAAVRLIDAVNRYLGRQANPVAGIAASSTGTPARATIAAIPATTPSIAVLPFANLSGDKEQEYFSDGLAEELINTLAQIPGLKVIARSSAFAFRGQNSDVRRIGETLGVAHVLEGSVRRSSNRIRVTAQLIATLDGSQLWSERYDRELADVFAVQDEIAAAITVGLQGKLAAPARIALRYTPKLAAYEALLKARHFHWKSTAESMAVARGWHEQAIALDAAYAAAHAEYAEFLIALSFLDLSHLTEMAPLARDMAQKALALDPGQTDAHGTLCAIAAIYDHDWQQAHRHFVLATAEGHATTLSRLCCAFGYLLPSGQLDAATQQFRASLQDDPLHLVCRSLLGMCLAAAGQHAEAQEVLREARALDPDHVLPMEYIAHDFFAQGRLAEATAAADELFARSPWYLQGLVAYAGLHVRGGDEAHGRETLQRLDPAGPGYSTDRGAFHLFCDELDEAADWFERAIDARDALPCMILQMCIAARLRAHSRWPRLAAMMKLPGSRP